MNDLHCLSKSMNGQTSQRSAGAYRKPTDTNLFRSTTSHHHQWTSRQYSSPWFAWFSLPQELKCLHETFWDTGFGERHILWVVNPTKTAPPQHGEDPTFVVFLFYVGTYFNYVNSVLSKHNIKMVVCHQGSSPTSFVPLRLIWPCVYSVLFERWKVYSGQTLHLIDKNITDAFVYFIPWALQRADFNCSALFFLWHLLGVSSLAWPSLYLTQSWLTLSFRCPFLPLCIIPLIPSITSSALKMETAFFPEMLVPTKQSTLHLNPEECHHYCHRCEKLKYMFFP